MFDAHVDKLAKNVRFEQLARMLLFFAKMLRYILH